jgi:hypothetical protein
VSKWVKIGFFLGLFALLGLIVWLVLRVRESEPIVQGRPLSHWLAESQFADPLSRMKANEIIDTVGTNSIPTLLRFLRRYDSDLERKLIQLLKRQRLVSVRLNTDVQRNYQGALGFARLGPAAYRAIPELINIFNENISGPSRFWTITSLGSIGPAASNAIPLLVSTLNDTNTTLGLRLSCITTLQMIHGAPEVTIPSLINALGDQQTQVKYYALTALGAFGMQARPAVPALKNLLNDPDLHVKRRAADLLSNIQEKDG